jgi:hypothetical protein
MKKSAQSDDLQTIVPCSGYSLIFYGFDEEGPWYCIEPIIAWHIFSWVNVSDTPSVDGITAAVTLDGVDNGRWPVMCPDGTCVIPGDRTFSSFDELKEHLSTWHREHNSGNLEKQKTKICTGRSGVRVQ